MSSIWSLMRAFAWGTSYSVRYKMFCGGFEAADKSHRRWRLVAAGNKKVGIADGRSRQWRRKKHAERAVPAGTNFLLRRAKSCQWQVFVRRRPPKQGELRTDVSKATMFQGDRKVYKGGFAAARWRGAAKGFSWVRAKLLFGALIRGLQNLESPFGKVLILFHSVSAKPPLRRAESRFGKPRNSRQGSTDCYFLRRAKSNQKARGASPATRDSNLRSIQDFCKNDRPSSCNRPRRKAQPFRISPVRI